MYFRPFTDGEPYTQECGPNCDFLKVLNRGEVGDMAAGRVVMRGPTWNQLAAHDQWHQFYLLLRGAGTMRVGDERVRVEAPGVIMIPYNTPHAMELAEDEEVEYVYVNQYLNEGMDDSCKKS